MHEFPPHFSIHRHDLARWTFWLFLSVRLCATSIVLADSEAVSLQVRSVGYECHLLGCRPVTQLGSGTVIGRWRGQHAVLTCAHVLQKDGRHQVSVQGNWIEAEWIAGEPKTDLAIIVFPHDGELPYARIATTSPVVEASVSTGGYPHGGPFRSRSGKVRGCVGSKPELTFSPAVESGESGGGLFADGELCGVIWGTDTQRDIGYATPIEVVHAFLKRRHVILEFPNTAPSGRYQRDRPATSDAPFVPVVPRPDPTPPITPVSPPVTPNPPVDTAPPVTSPPEGTSDIPWPGILTAIAAAFGVGTPVGLGLAALGWILKRRGEQRRERGPPSETSLPPEYVPVAVDSPPPPQQVISETHFTPYETNRYSRAHAWAREQMARKYPGSVDLLETEQQLIKQFLAATPAVSTSSFRQD